MRYASLSPRMMSKECVSVGTTIAQLCFAVWTMSCAKTLIECPSVSMFMVQLEMTVRKQSFSVPMASTAKCLVGIPLLACIMLLQAGLTLRWEEVLLHFRALLVVCTVVRQNWQCTALAVNSSRVISVGSQESWHLRWFDFVSRFLASTCFAGSSP